MLLWSGAITTEDLDNIANELGICAEVSDVDGMKKRRNGSYQRKIRFRILPQKGSERYQKIKQTPYTKSGERKAYAVCWHGHRDFMFKLFELDPNARLQTAMADYRGMEGFRATYPETAHKNVGSMMFPVSAQDECHCWDKAVY